MHKSQIDKRKTKDKQRHYYDRNSKLLPGLNKNDTVRFQKKEENGIQGKFRIRMNIRQVRFMLEHPKVYNTTEIESI
jgi:hypothetical protein